MTDLQILIEEVARIALEDADMRSRIGHELDASDEELEKAFQHLESKLNNEMEKPKDAWMEWLDANSYGMRELDTKWVAPRSLEIANDAIARRTNP